MSFQFITHFTSPDKSSGIKIISPASGQIDLIDNSEINPSQMAISLMGAGVKIKLEAQNIVSPIDGKIIEWEPSHGKVVIQAKNKLRFLIQLPFSHITHHGLGITSHITKGQQVKINQPLMTLDLYKIQLIEKPIFLFFILLDHKPFKSINVFHKHVLAGEDAIFSLLLKPTKQAVQK